MTSNFRSSMAGNKTFVLNLVPMGGGGGGRGFLENEGSPTELSGTANLQNGSD